MTDEEIIARDLGEVVGDRFLYWDRMIVELRAAVELPDEPERIAKAHAVIDDYMRKHPQFPR